MKYPTRSMYALCAALLVSAACDDSTPTGSPELPEAPAASRGASSERRREPLPDDEFARVARTDVPGFGGYYIQADGTPVVLLTDPRQRGAAERWLATQLPQRARGRLAAAAGRRPVVRTVAYDFAQLRAWADQLEGLFVRPDVYLLDVDEVGNRVFVGVGSETAVGAVRSEAARLGVPAAALHVETQEAPRPRINLTDWTPNLQGGYQINPTPGPYGQCTLGFNAIRNGQSVFVTNSHCSQSYFALDNGGIGQPNLTAGNQIGAEIADTPLFYCGPYVVVPCRESDSAIMLHNGTRTVNQGVIARTAWNTGGPGGLTVTGTYTIRAKYAGFTPVGTWLDKTGRTTGTTYGQVTQSCVRINSLQCQDISKVYSAGGDSGSPMYIYLGTSEVELQGILWGGPGTDYTTTYSSRLYGIERDLGAISVCAPGYGC
jgi:hypothetical protein